MKADLFWIEGPWSGRLAILPRPRGGDWLEDEIPAWRSAGVDLVVSTLRPDEISELDLTAEAEWCRKNEIEFISFPIADRGVPSSPAAVLELLRRLENAMTAGKIVAIHCRQGIGRSALLAASLLVLAGVSPDQAFQRVQAARGCPVPDTAEQREWVARFARDHLAALPPG
jgi:protein-tyrosine phosphatase